MSSLTFDIDQAQREAQDTAALDLRLDGIEDGYNGVSTQTSDWAYLIGFAEGLQRRNTEQLERVQHLVEMGKKEDEIARGEGWIEEMMQGNDEPELFYDSLIEEF